MTTVGAIPLGLPGGMAGWRLVDGKRPEDFRAFSADPMVKRDLAYLREALPKVQTSKALLKDRRLQEMVLKAFGLGNQIGMNGLMEKILDSDPEDPKSTASRMVDYRYRDIARALGFGRPVVEAIPPIPSRAELLLEGLYDGKSFDSFAGTFGGVSVANVDLSKATDRTAVAAALQKAFQRADGGRSDITVSALGLKIVMADAKGRGMATGLTFSTDEPTLSAGLGSNLAGYAGLPASGGPKVGDPNVIETIVSRYSQAAFEERLGESSDTLRKAVYAKRTLPRITSWYSVIADRPLAQVLQTALGLPESMGRLDVDKQKAIFEKRMKVEDLQDQTKVKKLLERYVATSSVNDVPAWTSASGVAAMIQPVSPWGGSNFSGASSAALFAALSRG